LEKAAQAAKEVCMRRLILLPLLSLVFACNDNTLTEPELAISPESGLLQAAARDGDAVKMVPYKGKGALMIVGVVAGCGDDPGLLSVSVAIEMRATHTGRSNIAMTNCFTPAMEFIETDTGIITTANGDLIYVYGSLADYGTTHPFHSDGTYEFGPVHFVGGTGRFEGATGKFEAWGVMDESGLTGTVISEGWISTVGAKK
jgi:hypothetical protein